MRERPTNPLISTLQIDSADGAQPTSRTMRLLRAYDLVPLLEQDPVHLLGKVQEISIAEPTSDHIYAIAEVAYVGAKRMEAEGHYEQAMNLYGAALANAYFYLFDPALKHRNPYDPRFRLAADIYNNALESSMRHVRQCECLRPGGVVEISTPHQDLAIRVAPRETWHEQNFGELKFVSDFRVNELTNRYHTYGLGVPMIAVYESEPDTCSADEFYPPGMTFPVTAILRVTETSTGQNGRIRHECVVELHDPLVASEIQVGHQDVPLETDLTTPLAYSLDNSVFKKANAPIRGLRQPEESMEDSGLYLLEPFDPQKIPVVMVHGFWSSLVTWMEMFNDLRGDAALRDRYQFWFYLYPTGQPYWHSAAALRNELAYARERLDPGRRTPVMDQMVLVGHSMGGLISRLQTLDSGDQFWNLNSVRSIDELEVDSVLRQSLRDAFYFSPNPSVKRVVTIATPHRGSRFSNEATQWLGSKLINLPEQFLSARSTLLTSNPSFFLPDAPALKRTNIEGLDPSSVFLQEMLNAKTAPWVRYHAIIGSTDGDPNGSDGVVEVQSARLPHAESELLVVAEHTKVHQSPTAIHELRRILLDHLALLESAQPLDSSTASIR